MTARGLKSHMIIHEPISVKPLCGCHISIKGHQNCVEKVKTSFRFPKVEKTRIGKGLGACSI